MNDQKNSQWNQKYPITSGNGLKPATRISEERANFGFLFKQLTWIKHGADTRAYDSEAQIEDERMLSRFRILFAERPKAARKMTMRCRPRLEYEFGLFFAARFCEKLMGQEQKKSVNDRHSIQMQHSRWSVCECVANHRWQDDRNN